MRFVPGLLLVVVLGACGETTQPAIIPQLDIIAGDAQVDTVGKTLPTQLAARLTDRQSGAPLPGRVVNWVVVEGGGSVFAAVTQTATDGTARQDWTLGMTVGSQKLVARWLNPETGEAVTIDTARATGLPAWNLTIRITNNSNAATHFSWQDGIGRSGADTIAIGATRCERLAIRSDSAAFHADAGAASYDQPFFSAAARPAWTMDVSTGSMLVADAGPAC